jgi:pimeloyl-ACP methyl ester carboxylesterase
MLDRSHRVIRIDLLGHGRSAKPSGRGYGIPDQARRVGGALDRLGVKCAIVVGHSTGGSVATALAEQRRDQVKALALINSCPSLDADTSPGLLSRLLPVPIVGHLMWRLLTGPMTRKAMSTGFGRGYEIPQHLVDCVRSTTYHAFTATSRAALDYLEQHSLPERLAVLDTPLLVIFGEEDGRCRSSAAAEYHAVPGARVELLNGLGHSPMVEDPPRTAALLQVFTASVLSGQ